MSEEYYNAIATIRTELDKVESIQDLFTEFKDFTDMFLELFEEIKGDQKADVPYLKAIGSQAADNLERIDSLMEEKVKQ